METKEKIYQHPLTEVEEINVEIAFADSGLSTGENMEPGEGQW